MSKTPNYDDYKIGDVIILTCDEYPRLILNIMDDEECNLVITDPGFKEGGYLVGFNESRIRSDSWIDRKIGEFPNEYDSKMNYLEAFSIKYYGLNKKQWEINSETGGTLHPTIPKL